MCDLATTANIIGGFFTAIGVIVALFAIMRESREARFTLNVDLLMKLWEQFDGEQMRRERKFAASALLDLLDGKKPDGSKTESLNRILNFFELLGLLLKNKAIDKASADVMISFWYAPYWQAVTNPLHPNQPSYIDEARVQEKLFWKNAENAASVLVPKKESFDREKIKNFLLTELNLKEKAG